MRICILPLTILIYHATAAAQMCPGVFGEGPDKDKPHNKATASPWYARFQLAKAFKTAVDHADQQVRENAVKKIERWKKVLWGMFDGSITVGSRKPVAAPEWVTLEVVAGGFTTGNYLAGGPFLEHELKLAQKLGIEVDDSTRGRLNSYFISDEGLSVLREAYQSGRYEISVPEEGALLSVVWLLDQGQIKKANKILNAITPYFETLRFYPAPRSKPLTLSNSVHLYTVGEIKDKIAAYKLPEPVSQLIETISVWLPLYDRFISLFLSSVVGDMPEVKKRADGKPLFEDGKYEFTKKSESYHFDSTFKTRLVALLKELDEKTDSHRLCKRPFKRSSSLYQIHLVSEELVKNNFVLNNRLKGYLDLILGCFVGKHGLPDSDLHSRQRRLQQDEIKRLINEDIAKELVNRLSKANPDEGLDDVEPYLVPFKSKNLEEIAIPESFRNKIKKCQSAPINTLIDQGIITSGDSLARVLPQITANIQAMGFQDPETRRLYSSLYRAFRKRRSLLLFNFESQVRISEIPWIKALEDQRQKKIKDEEAAKEALRQIVTQTITSFPYAIIPNKLLQEIRVLSQTANLDIPIVDELAADIFMGSFSPKFQAASTFAARLLKGTLYERYYNANYQELMGLQTTGNAFSQACISRTEIGDRYWSKRWWDPATNGTIIEQQQILTTQNLAPLFSELGLTESLRDQMIALAEKCLKWIFEHQLLKTENPHARLIMMKNSAYAWRQMIFFLSLADKKEVTEFISRMEHVLSEQKPDFQTRFMPAWEGLKAAVDGKSPDSAGKVFLGWTTKQHWMLEHE